VWVTHSSKVYYDRAKNYGQENEVIQILSFEKITFFPDVLDCLDVIASDLFLPNNHSCKEVLEMFNFVK